MQYKICPDCGAHLDPGERCDCQRIKKETAPLQRERSQIKEPNLSLTRIGQKVKSPGRQFYGR